MSDATYDLPGWVKPECEQLDELRAALLELRKLDRADLVGTAERLRILASTMEQVDRARDAQGVLLASRVLDAVAREGVSPPDDDGRGDE